MQRGGTLCYEQNNWVLILASLPTLLLSCFTNLGEPSASHVPARTVRKTARSCSTRTWTNNRENREKKIKDQNGKLGRWKPKSCYLCSKRPTASICPQRPVHRQQSPLPCEVKVDPGVQMELGQTQEEGYGLPFTDCAVFSKAGVWTRRGQWLLFWRDT